jgi:hypothetical protein
VGRALRDTVDEHIKGLLVEQEKYYLVNEPTWSFTELGQYLINLRLIMQIKEIVELYFGLSIILDF